MLQFADDQAIIARERYRIRTEKKCWNKFMKHENWL